MTDLNAAIYDYLAATTAVTNLVGTRIRPDLLDDRDQLPALVFWRVSGRHLDTIQGTFGRLVEARVTIGAYAAKRSKANEVAEAVRLAIIQMRGTRSGVSVRNVSCDTGQSHYVNLPTDGTEVARYVASQDFLITFLEDV